MNFLGDFFINLGFFLKRQCLLPWILIASTAVASPHSPSSLTFGTVCPPNASNAPLSSQNKCLVESVQKDFAAAPDKYIPKELRQRRLENWGQLSRKEQVLMIAWLNKNMSQTFKFQKSYDHQRSEEKVFQLQKHLPYQNYSLNEATVRLAILVYHVSSLVATD